MKKNESLIHVKLEYGEALQSKRDVLSSEMNLVRISKSINRYKTLRSEELKIKYKLSQKIKEFLINIRKIQTTLPKLQIPEILKEDKEKDKRTIELEKDNSDLETQLKEIQEKLKSLKND